MNSVYPVYSSIDECTNECGSFFSYCTGNLPTLVCQLNFSIFIAVIFLAIFTGVCIPLSCLFCWINGGFAWMRRGTSSLPFIRSNRRNRRGTGGAEDERSSLYPSSPPTLQPQTSKSRQPSSFSLPAVDTVIEKDPSRQAKRCRKITFDLSMSTRVNEFSQL
ncbi:unnamed protein product [Caenorhabditis bovis]|uniref:Uncharacterized protein n=1 Tax=Caenorhabditis bovis TaxID=2654633 RepID=A0A8S1E947_9PELO|nr:unnamed protein product [Caenorhabditis bovis]